MNRLLAAEAAGISVGEVGTLVAGIACALLLVLGAVSAFLIKVLPAMREPKSIPAPIASSSAADHIDLAITELRAAAESCRATETSLQGMLRQGLDELGERIDRRFDRQEERVERRLERQDERLDALVEQRNSSGGGFR